MFASRWTLCLILALAGKALAINFGDIPANTVEPLSTWVPPTLTLTINGVTQDLSANRSWTITTGGTPGGSNTQVQYNDSGAFGGNSAFTFDKTTTTFNLDGIAIAPFVGGTKFELPVSGASFIGFGPLGGNDIVALGYSAGTGQYFADATIGDLNIRNQQATGRLNFGVYGTRTTATMSIEAAIMKLASDSMLAWTPSSSITAPDTALARNATGVVEINNGTAGQFRDLTLRNLTVNGTCTGCGGAGGGNVSNVGTPTNGQLALWTTATTIQGVTALPAANEPAHTGDVTNSAGSLGLTIANNAVTYGKMQAASAASKLIGSPSTGTALGEITLGTNLSMSGTTLNATGGAGGTPGGANKNIQFNDSGAFGGDAAWLFDKTGSNPAVQLTKAQNAVTAMDVTNGTNNTGAVAELTLHNSAANVFAFGLYSPTTTAYGSWGSGEGGIYIGGGANMVIMADGGSGAIKFAPAGNTLRMQFYNNDLQLSSNGSLLWNSAPFGTGGIDAGITRNTSGTVEVNNGTAGQFRDLKIRNLTATAIANLTSNGFVKTSGAVGTLSVDTNTYLTSATGVTTFSSGNLSPLFTVTPSSATSGAVSQAFTLSTAGAHNFLGNNTGSTAAPAYVQPAFSDLSGSVAAAQMPALTGDVTTTAGTVATTIANGAVTYAKMQNETSGTVLGRTGSLGPPQELLVSSGLYTSGTNLLGKFQHNAATATQPSITTETYLTGSTITINAGDIANQETYHAVVYVTKTGAGTAAASWVLRMGTNGSTGDAAIITNSLGAQTAVVDTGIVDIFVTFTSPGATANTFYANNLTHNIANGLWPFAAGVTIGAPGIGTAFNSTAVTKIGLSWIPGSGSTHTVAVLTADLLRP